MIRAVSLLLLLPALAFAAGIERLPAEAAKEVPRLPESFKHYVPYAISYSPGWGNHTWLFLAPELAAKAELFKASPDAPLSVRFVAGSVSFIISYDPGPSEDPMFVLTSPALAETVELQGDTLYVAPAPAFYLEARSNEDFTVRRKYLLRNKSLEEVRQPFYLVELDCEASRDFMLYQKQCDGGDEVARVPKGGKVEVLVKDPQAQCPGRKPVGETGDPEAQYLVKTSFGLVGWVSSTSGYLARKGNPLACLDYHGD